MEKVTLLNVPRGPSVVLFVLQAAIGVYSAFVAFMSSWFFLDVWRGTSPPSPLTVDKLVRGEPQPPPDAVPTAAVFAGIQALLLLYTLAMAWAWTTRRWTVTVLQARVHVPVLLLATLPTAAVAARVLSWRSLVRPGHDMTPMLLVVGCVPSLRRLH
jgi:hypothetical protein